MVVTAMALFHFGCDDRSSQFRGETNISMPFYGRVVDQDGTPLADAHVAYQVEAYPSDWSFDKRDADHVFSEATAVSAADGTFTMNVTGAMIRMRSVTRDGYEHLWEKDVSDGTPSVFFYRLIASGRQGYRASPDHPAIYIMVKKGLNYSRVLPCRGGSMETLHGWVPNPPLFPSEPSIKGIRFLVDTRGKEPLYNSIYPPDAEKGASRNSVAPPTTRP